MPLIPNGAPLPPYMKQVPTRVTTPPFDFTELLRACQRRWLLCLSTALLLGILGTMLAWYFLPITTRYTARTLLQVSSRAPKIVFEADSQPDFGSYQRTTIALIKSRLVLNASLKQPGILHLNMIRQLGDPITWLEKNLLIDFSIGPEILRIALNGENQDEIKQIVEAVRTSYLSEVVDREKNRRRDQLKELERLWKESDERLREKRTRLRQLAESVGSGEEKAIAMKQEFALANVNALEKEYFSIAAELRRQRVEVSVLETREKTSDQAIVSETRVEELLKSDPVYQQQLAKMQLARQVLIEAEERLGKDTSVPALKRYVNDVQQAEKDLDSKRKELRPQIIKQLRDQNKQEITSTLLQLREKVTKLAELEKQLVADVSRLSEEAKSLNKKALDLESEKKEIKSMEAIQDHLSQRKDVLKLELEAPSRVNQLEDVILQENSSRKGPIIIAGAGFAAGLIGLLGIGYWEYSRRRVYSAEQLVSDVGTSLIGTLPLVPERVRLAMNQSQLSLDNGHKKEFITNIYKESIDTARSFLLHAASSDECQVIMITSALSGEGKTTLATSLSSSIARSGKRTLLMECDLRRPTAHKLLNLPGGPGICEVLRKEARLSQVMQRSPQKHLWFLPAGHLNEGALAMLSMDGMRRLFAVLRKKFEIIIVDTAPVLPVADTLLIAKHVDAAVLTVLKDVSRTPKVTAAIDRLQSLGVRILGTVISCTEQHSYKSSYHYYGTPGASQPALEEAKESA
jgi:polysaccharide biosynthesis transport protein